MPFTITHPAIVLPLKKLWPKYFSLTGLMAGAMAPDLLYFLILTTVERGLSHSWFGFFIFCVPAGIAFSFAFHWLFKAKFIYNLPSPFDRYLSGLADYKWKPIGLRGWIVFIISVIIGVMSHFFWDSLTHIHGVLVMKLPILREQVLIFGRSVYYARILQHLSTIFGGLTILIFLVKGNIIPKPINDYSRIVIADKLRFWAWGIVCSFLFTFLAVNAYNFFMPHHPVSNYTIGGLSSWAGFFWYVVTLSIFRKISPSGYNKTT